MCENDFINPIVLFSWLARTDPADVARVESRTFICAEQERMVVPAARAGQKSALGNYISPREYETAVGDRFPGCMRGEDIRLPTRLNFSGVSQFSEYFAVAIQKIGLFSMSFVKERGGWGVLTGYARDPHRNSVRNLKWGLLSRNRSQSKSANSEIGKYYSGAGYTALVGSSLMRESSHRD